MSMVASAVKDAHTNQSSAPLYLPSCRPKEATVMSSKPFSLLSKKSRAKNGHPPEKDGKPTPASLFVIGVSSVSFWQSRMVLQLHCPACVIMPLLTTTAYL